MNWKTLPRYFERNVIVTEHDRAILRVVYSPSFSIFDLKNEMNLIFKTDLKLI